MHMIAPSCNLLLDGYHGVFSYRVLKLWVDTQQMLHACYMGLWESLGSIWWTLQRVVGSDANHHGHWADGTLSPDKLHCITVVALIFPGRTREKLGSAEKYSPNGREN